MRNEALTLQGSQSSTSGAWCLRGTKSYLAALLVAAATYREGPSISSIAEPLAPRKITVQPQREIEDNARASNLAFKLAAQAETAARQALANGYRLCAACSMRVVAAELCAHHTAKERVDGWAAANRIWCEFVHGKWRARRGAPTAPTGQE